MLSCIGNNVFFTFMIGGECTLRTLKYFTIVGFDTNWRLQQGRSEAR